MHDHVWKYASTLSSGPMLILFALAHYADDNGKCWPSMHTLAAKCGMTRRNVIKTLDRLEAMGIVRVERRRTATGQPAANVYYLSTNGMVNPSSLCERIDGEPQFTMNAPDSEPQGTIDGEPQDTTIVNKMRVGGEPQFTVMVNPSSHEPIIEQINKNKSKEPEAAAESSTHVRAGAREAAAAAAAEPAPSAPASVDLGKDRAPVAEQGRGAPHPLLAAWIEAHVERGITATITKDLQRIAENYARMGLQADDVRGLTAHKLAGGRSEYSFRFIEADVTAWRNARFESQMQRPGGAPARRFDADAWEPEPAAPPAVPRPFDARWKATFEKAWLSLDAQTVREGNATADWRHLQKAQLMDADGTRFVLAFETPVGVAVANKWGRNIERMLFDAGLGVVPREVRMEAITMDEWRKRLTQMQPAAAPAAAAV